MTERRWQSLRLRPSCVAVLFELPHPIWARWIPFLPWLLHDGLSFFGPVCVGLDEKPAGRGLDYFKLYWLRRHSRTNEARAAYVPWLRVVLMQPFGRQADSGGRRHRQVWSTRLAGTACADRGQAFGGYRARAHGRFDRLNLASSSKLNRQPSFRNDPPPSLFLLPDRRKILEVHRGDLCARQRWFGDPSSPCGCFFDHSSRGQQESKTGFVALAATRRKERSRSQWERRYRLYNRWLIEERR